MQNQTQTDDGQTPEQSRLQVQTLFLGWLKEAVDARLQSGIEDEWQEAEDLYAGLEPGVASTESKPQKPVQGRSRVIINITESKTGIGSSQVIRRVLPGDMRPWKVEPTPVPEYDEAINGGSGNASVQLQDGSVHPAADVAKALTVLLKDKSDRAGNQIQDWLTDTAIYNGKSAYAELRKMIKDGARVGTGVIKGPIPTVKKERRWKIDQSGIATIEVSEKLVPRAVAISVANCFPDPSCGDDIHKGTYFIERDYLTPRQVRELKQQPGYEANELATVLQQGPLAYSRWDDRYKSEREGQTRVYDRKTFETFYLYADVTPAQLIACGFEIPALTIAPAGLSEEKAAQAIASQIEAAMELDSIPIVATMINGRIVKVVLNPNEKGGFPYRFFRWSIVEGRPYGKGIPLKISTPQKMLTSSVRAMMENAGQSAGPIICMAKEKVTPVDGTYAVARNKFFEFEASETMDDVRKAFGLFTVPSVQEQLFNIVKASQEWADQLADIPLLMQGITGSSPDTLGGMEMLEANAASPLLDIAKEYDEVLAPLISDFYDWMMQDPNVSKDCKGDFQCKAIGASVLIHRDRKAIALQQVVAPMANDPAFELSKARVGEQILKSVEIEPESVKLTEDEKQAAAQQKPPVDPRIEAAQIKRQTDIEVSQAQIADRQQEREFKAQQAAEDRALQKLLSDVEFQVQAMEFAGQKEITFEQLRAMLATKAMDLRNKRDLFAAEKQFALTAGDGRGL